MAPRAAAPRSRKGRPAAAGGATPADIPARRPAEPDPDRDRADHGGQSGHGQGGYGSGEYGEYGARPAGPRRWDPADRGLRGLVAAGPSQVGVTGAMRARDAARPRPEDLEAAERELTIVRRFYVPPEGSSPVPPTPEPE